MTNPFGTPVAAQAAPSPQVDNGKHNKIITTFMSKFLTPELVQDIVNASMYNVDVNALQGAGKTSDTMGSISTFLTNMEKDFDKLRMLSFPTPIPVMKAMIRFAKRVIELRNDTGTRLITYDNLDEHFANVTEFTIQKMIQNIKNNRITNIHQFREKFDVILQTIQLANELRNTRKMFHDLDSVIEEAQDGDMPLLALTMKTRDIINESYSNLSGLRIVNKISSLSDYLVISDEESIGRIASDITTYLSTGYSFYKSGYGIIDDNIGGIESSNLHIICGPTNHAKSIFMINLSWQMLLNNIQDFQDNDCFVWYTLEDDIYKLMRRFISIYGNYHTSQVKELFIRASSLFKKQKNIDMKQKSPLFLQVEKLMRELIEGSIFRVTGKKIKFLMKHCRETTSTSDIIKFLNAQRCQGLNIKALFIDYIDIMIPSNTTNSNYKDYENQGIISIELRNLASEFSIPVITITQANKEAELAGSLGVHNLADSHRKARFSDYIYLVRQRTDLTILSECVKENVLPPTGQQDVTLSDLTNKNNSNLIPFEVKIAKSKDGAKNLIKYHLFAGDNLRIYEKLHTFYGDVPDLQRLAAKLNSDISLLNVNSMQSVPLPTHGNNVLI